MNYRTKVINGIMKKIKIKANGKHLKLYYHKTSGGAEYLCSNKVKGTSEGSFSSKYIVRIDGDIRKDAELFIK